MVDILSESVRIPRRTVGGLRVPAWVYAADCALRVRGDECFFIPEDVALGYGDIIKEGERLFQWRK